MKIRSGMVLQKHDRTIDTPPLPYKARIFDTNSFAHTAEATSLAIELRNDTTTVLAEKGQQECTSTHLRHGRSPRMILFTSSPIEPERLCCNAVNKYERNIEDARNPHIGGNTCMQTAYNGNACLWPAYEGNVNNNMFVTCMQYCL